jgi:predicted phage terminase large subunit-like protein
MRESQLNSEEWERGMRIESLLGADAVLDFVRRASPVIDGRLPVPMPHLRPLAEFFVRCEREPVRLAASFAPRMGKTTLVQHGIVRSLWRAPWRRWWYATHTATMAQKKNAYMLALAQRLGLPVTGTRKEWRLPQGGGVLCGGIKAPWTGDGPHCMVVDDPTEDRAEAESPTHQRTIIDWLTSTMSSRLQQGASMLVMHQRWTPNDMIGYLIDGQSAQRWERVNVPVIDDAGEPTWPEAWTREQIELKRAGLDDYSWASQFMGQPRTRGHTLFRDVTYYEQTEPAKYARTIITCDPAATAKTSADYSAVVVASGWRDAQGLLHMDVLDVRRMQCEIPLLVHELGQLQAKYNAPIAVEAVAGFLAVPQMLRSTDKRLRVYAMEIKGDKFARSLPVSSGWNDGRVRIPRAAWSPTLLRELHSFTGTGGVEHDDQVDALAYAWTELEQLLLARTVPLIQKSPAMYA